HAGDLIPLLSVGGKAWSSFYTGRFYPEDIIGRTVVIHNMPDDFRSQPAGDSGEKIACGVIEEQESDGIRR
ncbi:MAG: superoxide dismutase family protein, partial [Peptococcaceae bacterium]|nr:superoxide dismutase family protein [Peptococcaceae bacterium]